METSVVKDEHVITSKGPGTAMAFSLQLIEHLTDHTIAEKVSDGLLYSKT